MKRTANVLAAFAAVLIMLSSLAVTAFAESTSYEIDELFMSISIPNEMLAITRDSEKTDSYFSKFGLDYKETMNMFKDGNIYLQAMKDDGSLTLTVTMDEDQNSRNINNYNRLDDSDLKDIMNKYLNDEAYKSGTIVESNGVKYIYLTVSTKSGKKIIQAQQYCTVTNGMSIVITLDAPAGHKLTSDDRDLLSNVIKNTYIADNNFFEKYKEIIIYGGITLFGVAVAVFVLIFLLKKFRNPNRKNDRIVHDLAHEHRISETTRLPKKKNIFSITKPTSSFMKNYKPVDEIEKKQPPQKPANPRIEQEKATEARVAEKKQAPAPKEKPQPKEEAPKPKREVPLAQKIVADSSRRVSEEEQSVPIAQPIEYAEPKEGKPALKPERAPVSQREAVEVNEDENFEQVENYFEEVPEKKDMYAYTDVGTAVDEYTAAKVESELIRQESRESAETLKRILTAIGRGILSVFKGIGLVLIYIVIHLKYFFTNLYRAIRKNHAKKKRMKIEEERRRRALEQRRIQREAQRARQRQNANRGENDLVKVRSSEERPPVRRNPYPGSQRPQQRRIPASRPRNGQPPARRRPRGY